MMPVTAKAPHHQLTRKAPMRIRNSPMKPFRPGRPMEENMMMAKRVA